VYNSKGFITLIGTKCFIWMFDYLLVALEVYTVYKYWLTQA